VRTVPTEAETSRAILEYLAAERIFAFRINTAAFKVDQRFFRAHSLGKGAADILALPRMELTVIYADGRTDAMITIPTWIEVKSPTGKQSPEQKTFEFDMRSRGHTYLLARSVDDVIKVVTGLRK
jgi:hypothetical protein